MNLFGQGQYMFDLRQSVDSEAIQAAVAAMNQNFTAETQKIKAVLPAVQADNVFDLIKEA
jgi:hypothetical protein